jgi:hypothetical protein
MRFDVDSPKKRILAVSGIGIKPTREGRRKRKMVAGRMVHEKTAQLNVKITKAGKQSLFEEPKPEGEEQPAEAAPKEEAKEEVKDAKPAAEKKDEPKQEEKKPEEKEQAPAEKKKEEQAEKKDEGNPAANDKKEDASDSTSKGE